METDKLQTVTSLANIVFDEYGKYEISELENVDLLEEVGGGFVNFWKCNTLCTPEYADGDE